MHCPEYRDLVAAHVDGQLTPEEMALAAAHLEVCPACTRRWEGERQLKHLMQDRRLLQTAPTVLRERVLARLDAEDRRPRTTVGASAWRLARVPRLALAGALVVVAIVIAAHLRSGPHAPGTMLAQVIADYHAAEMQGVKLDLQTNDPEQLRQYYQRTGKLEFTNTVMDLRPFGLDLVGGSLVKLTSKDSTFTLYRGGPVMLLCHRIWAPDLPLPPGGEVIKGNTFYTSDGITVCIHREGGVVCFLATAMPRDEFIRRMTERA